MDDAPQNHKRKVALYARVSSREEQNRQTPENQLIILRRRAEWDNLEVYKEYVDHASGADPNRPALAQLERDMRAMRFRAVYVVRLDRITRSLQNLLQLIKSFQEHGVEFICTEQDIRTDTSSGKLLMHVLGALAEFERNLISERTKEGLDRARSEGRVGGRDPIEVDIDRARSMKAEGKTNREICAELGISRATLLRRLKKEVGN